MTTSTRDHYESDEHEKRSEKMRCGDCGRRIYYDRADNSYHHLRNKAKGCFLIPPERAL